MEINYRTNISKWLPCQDFGLEEWSTTALKVIDSTNRYARYIILILENEEKYNFNDKQIIEPWIDSLDQLIHEYQEINYPVDSSHVIFKHKLNHLSCILKSELKEAAKLIGHLLTEVTQCVSHDFFRTTFRLIIAYNTILEWERSVTDATINLYSNDCPPMLEIPKRMSLVRFLQVLAKNHAESHCHDLIDCLLANYEPIYEGHPVSPESPDVEFSENSSMEIYRALTKHMTPPAVNVSVKEKFTSNGESIEALVNIQSECVRTVLRIATDYASQLLKTDYLKKHKGEVIIKARAHEKISAYYQEVTWGAVSSILDHVVLWWSPEALAPRHSQGAYHLKGWLHQYIQGMNVSSIVNPALQTLCDALSSHVTVTAWDHLFRTAYISSFECNSTSATPKGTDTGQMFLETFQLLVTLSNECEIGGEWVVGAPLLELPLSEQIIALHRLDHSVHTMRMWAMQESRLIAHTWQLENFFLLIKNDVVNSLEQLSYLQLADHTNALQSECDNVHVYVCAKMRGKIVSEIDANIQLLKGLPRICIKTLSTICRVISLAHLHMSFPHASYSSVSSPSIPGSASSYVAVYFEKIFLPVLQVVEDHEISNMILRIMCEAWLDYIYLHRMKFSERGAFQLLADFAFVDTWVMACPILSIRDGNHLLKNEVLRRCEGVGRLLLRRPGEAINMHKPTAQSMMENVSPKSLGLERMPAEMYVPNQEQWLELRAQNFYNVCCNEI